LANLNFALENESYATSRGKLRDLKRKRAEKHANKNKAEHPK